MRTWRTIAVLVTVILILTAAGCGAADTATSVVPATAAQTTAPVTTATTEHTELTTVGPSEVATTTPPTTSPSVGEEYAVYSAYIDFEFHKPLIVIQAETMRPNSDMVTPHEATRMALSQWPDLGDDVVTDFETKNQASSKLERSFAISAEYDFISRQELDTIFTKNPDGWDDFYAKYPNSQGVLTLSRVGFNAALDTALLYAGDQYHWTGGEGGLVLLKKVDGVWTVKANAMMWMS